MTSSRRLMGICTSATVIWSHFESFQAIQSDKEYYIQRMKLFRDKLTLEERRASFEQQQKRHPGKVFVVGNRHSKSQMPACQPIKFVCDPLQKLHVIRRIIAKRVLPKTHPNLKNLEPEIVIYIYCGNRLLNGEQTMLEIQQKHQNKDGYLYLEFSEMETFG